MELRTSTSLQCRNNSQTYIFSSDFSPEVQTLKSSCLQSIFHHSSLRHLSTTSPKSQTSSPNPHGCTCNPFHTLASYNDPQSPKPETWVVILAASFPCGYQVRLILIPLPCLLHLSSAPWPQPQCGPSCISCTFPTTYRLDPLILIWPPSQII